MHSHYATGSVAHAAARISTATARALPSLITDATLYLKDACAVLGILVPLHHLRTKTTIPCSAKHVASALVEFVAEPNVATAKASYAVIAAYHATGIKRSDGTAVRLMREGVRAPELTKREVGRVPAGALDWQTQPVMGVNPAIWAEGAQLVELIEKRDRRIRGCRRVEKPVRSEGAVLKRGCMALVPAHEGIKTVRERSRMVRAVEALAAAWSAS